MRFLPSIAGYIYGAGDKTAYVNLYIAGDGQVDLAGNTVKLKQDTAYPWDGKVTLTVDPTQNGEFAIKLRIPGWARGEPIATDLYRYIDDSPTQWTVSINGVSVAPGETILIRTPSGPISWAA